jgi:hypothetical protein
VLLHGKMMHVIVGFIRDREVSGYQCGSSLVQEMDVRDRVDD